MNIFYLDTDPKTCATYHVDKHVVKMIVEYAQLLSTAHRVIDGRVTTVKTASNRSRKIWITDDDRNTQLYKSTHVNHPSAIWVRQSLANYTWLFSLWSNLLEEYTFRYNKVHASSRLYHMLETAPDNIPVYEFTQPSLAMPSEYLCEDAISAYRNYYKFGKTHLHAWKNRSIPEWANVSY